jgi:exonuclease VII small subunit
MLPDAAGLFRFSTLEEARCHLERVMGDYERQCKLARQLAEEHFDAKRNLRQVLETALA